MDDASSSKYVKKHHSKDELCYKRPTYRDSRWERAVKAYTINQESKYLLVLGVPAVGATKELLELFALYGDIEEYRILHEYPVEKFTEAYWIKYKRIQAARFGKKKLDNRSFFGGLLHVCYAPEYESENDTREKLNERKRAVIRKCKAYSAINSEEQLQVERSYDDDSSKSTEVQNTNQSNFTGPSQPSFYITSSTNLLPRLPAPPPPPPLSRVTPLHRPTNENLNYPRVPSHQATLPTDLQNLSATEVYPNLTTSTIEIPPLDETHMAIPTAHGQSSEDITIPTEKKIVWNKRAPDNPFGGVHKYTQEPGAWNPYSPGNKTIIHKENEEFQDSISAIRSKLKRTAEPSRIIPKLQEESPLGMSHETSEKEETSRVPAKKPRKNDNRKRI